MFLLETLISADKIRLWASRRKCAPLRKYVCHFLGASKSAMFIICYTVLLKSLPDFIERHHYLVKIRLFIFLHFTLFCLSTSKLLRLNHPQVQNSGPTFVALLMPRNSALTMAVKHILVVLWTRSAEFRGKPWNWVLIKRQTCHVGWQYHHVTYGSNFPTRPRCCILD